MLKLILIFLLFLFPDHAHAYLGPGVGLGILAATVGVILAIFAGLFGILWYPARKILKKKKHKKNETNTSS